MSQTRLAAAAGRHRHLNLLMTSTKQSYRRVTTNAKKAAETIAAEATPEPPTARQLATHAVKCAIPMIGFGFMVRGSNIFLCGKVLFTCSFQH